MKSEEIISISREKFNNMVSQILSRPEYSHLNNNYTSYLEKLKNYIKELLRKLFDVFTGSIEGIRVSDRAAYMVLVVCVVVIILVIALIALRISKSVNKNSRVRELFGTVIDENSTPFEMMKRSLIFKENRDYRNAVKFSFIAILLMMHNRNIIFLDEAKTNSEILDVLKSRGFSHTGVFETLVRLFNDIWYGHGDVTEDSLALWEKSSSLIWEEALYEAKDK